MMFKCLECNHLFEEGEQREWIEPHGEHLSGCPICGGAYTQAKPCPLCMEYEEVEEVGACKACIAELKQRAKDALRREFDSEQWDVVQELIERDELFDE